MIYLFTTLLLFTGGEFVIYGAPFAALVYAAARLFSKRRIYSHHDRSTGKLNIKVPNGKAGRDDFQAINEVLDEVEAGFGKRPILRRSEPSYKPGKRRRRKN